MIRLESGGSDCPVGMSFWGKGVNASYTPRVWCAPELGYLPVRIWRREKDGTEYTSELESASGALFGQVKIQAD